MCHISQIRWQELKLKFIDISRTRTSIFPLKRKNDQIRFTPYRAD